MFQPLGDRHKLPRHQSESFGHVHLSAKRVEDATVEAARHNDNLRPKSQQGRQDDALHRIKMRIVPRSWRQRHIDVCAVASIFASFRDISINRVIPILVYGNRKDIRIAVEQTLDTVAVVNVPTDSGDSINAVDFA